MICIYVFECDSEGCVRVSMLAVIHREDWERKVLVTIREEGIHRIKTLYVGTTDH